MKKAGLYIHIPFCKKKCSYCDFFSLKHSQFDEILRGKKGSKFATRIVNDVKYMKEKYQIDEWDTIYVGGGTPSVLSCNDMEFIFSSILKNQKNKPEEFTIEINPEDLTSDILKTLYSVNINRISMGMQSFSDEVLKKANRRGSAKQNIEAIKLVKGFNIGTMSCDLIAGLNGQNEKIIENDIKTLLEFSPEHISFYSLCTNKKLKADEIDYIDKLWLLGKNILNENSYIDYEVSNFAYKNIYKSIHNQKYWKLKDYIGVGPAACGSVFYNKTNQHNAYATRFMASTDMHKWLHSSDRDSVYDYENINEAELIEESIMMGLRINEGVNLKDFKTKYQKDLRQLISKSIEKWSKQNMLKVNDENIYLTDESSLFLNAFLEDAFDELEEK